MLVTFVLGSVHAFSVFIVPLEELFALPRSRVSLVYSVALLALTLAVFIGHRIYHRLSAWRLVVLTCGVAALGLFIAALGGNWWMMLFGYSLLFGFCNGVGYGFCLQLVGRVMPDIKGFAMGAVTAAYAVGSIVFARVIAGIIERFSVAAALLTMAALVAGCGFLAALTLGLSRTRYAAEAGDAGRGARLDQTRVAQFWLAYMTSVFAGLMAIGHAAGIALAKGAGPAQATLAAVAIGCGSALGGFASGWLVDRVKSSLLLIGLALLSMLALLSINVFTDPLRVIGALTAVGFGYGSIIAIYPVAISDCFADAGPRAYGLVFTAWGFAGLLAPWSAGLIYDLSASYAPAMAIAAALALVSALCVLVFRFDKSR